MKFVSFLETPEFTKKIVDLLTDEQLADLQLFLCENPDFGKLIRGSGGIRKIRCCVTGKGKSGGIRVLYYWVVDRDKIFLLDAYAKNDKETLTGKEIKLLRTIVRGLEDEKQTL